MTSQSSTINERSAKRAGFGAFFGFGLRQFWTTMLLFGIILFFVLPVPVLMIISERELVNADVLVSARNMFANDWAVNIRTALIPIMSALALVVSCSRFKYLKNKVSVDFYHSLPIKRGRLYLSQLAISALALLIPYLINVILTVIFIASNGLMSGTLVVNLLFTSLEAFVYAIFIYALTTLVGMISGMTSVQVTLTAVAVLIVPAIWALGLTFVSIFVENMWYDFYLREESLKYMSPLLRFALDSDPLTVAETGVSLLVSAAMLLLAYFLYTKRRSERSGTPVVFTPLGEVIKYVLMVVGMLLGGIFFYYVMNEDFIWTVFGMICGTVLVFMLTNTILNKTAKSMFKGWRGLCVFVGVSAVCLIVLLTNIFGINSYVPSPDSTSRTVVRIDYGSTYEFSEPECIAALHRIYTEGEHTPDYERNGGGNWHEYNTIGISIVFYPKVGVPVAKEVRIYNKYDFMEEFRALLDSDEFRGQYTGRIDSLSGDGYARSDLADYRIYEPDGELWRYNADNGWWFDRFSYVDWRARRIAIKEVIEANADCGFEHFQQQNIGELYIDSNGGSYNFPIYASMDDVVSRYIDEGLLTMTPDETIDAYTELIDGIKVCYAPEGVDVAREYTFTDKDEIRALLKASPNIHGDTAACEFTFVENDFIGYYYIDVNFGDYEGYTSGEGYYAIDSEGYEVYVEATAESADVEYITTESSDAKQPSSRQFEIAFLFGKVPDFVYEAFGIEKTNG